MHTLLCVCPPRVESLFSPVLSKACNQFPLGFKVWFSRKSSSCCQTPRLGSVMGGPEPSLQWVDFCGISVRQSVSHPPTIYGIWFYCDCASPTVSLWLLLCLWMWGIFFGEFQCLSVDDCPAPSCDSPVICFLAKKYVYRSSVGPLYHSPMIYILLWSYASLFLGFTSLLCRSTFLSELFRKSTVELNFWVLTCLEVCLSNIL